MKQTLFLLILLHLPSLANSQNTLTRRFSISAGISNLTIGFPFRNLNGSFNPGISDVGLFWRLTKKQEHHPYINISYSFHNLRFLGNTHTGTIGIGYHYLAKHSFFVNGGLLFGNAYQAYPTVTFQLEENNAHYIKVNRQLYKSAVAGFYLQTGYRIKLNSLYLSPFVKYSFQLISPYFNLKAFPIMPCNITQAGVIIERN